MCKLQLPGFVVRQAGLVSQVHKRLGYNLGDDRILTESCHSLLDNYIEYEHEDFGLHLDPEHPSGEPEISFMEDAIHLALYREGQIDESLFLPVGYTAQLEIDDSLVFLDWRTAHDFVTTVAPRAYNSGLYLAHTQ